MTGFANPFRPGAGHTPPYLAGRHEERQEFLKLLDQRPILENMVLTGLRGVGKTVLLDSFKPLAVQQGWLWVGADLSEATSLSEENLAIRFCTDLSPLTSEVVVATEEVPGIGFINKAERVSHTLDYATLLEIYHGIPGLGLDKLKGVLETVWRSLEDREGVRGIIFAYDEAQNLADRSDNDQYPLALLLDCFQSLQRQGIPMLLALTGLPTLFPKLVESRTFAERMFRVVFLQSLNETESEEAIRRPVRDADCPVHLGDNSVRTIIDMSGGYPYFIQFICREVYDAFIQRLDRGESAAVPVAEIEQKLDTDFFAGRWARATDRQRELMFVIAGLDTGEKEFSVQEVADRSRSVLDKPFSGSQINQMLAALTSRGLVYKHRHGKYSFAVPLLARFIRKQAA